MPAVIVEVGPDVAPALLLRELLAACSAAMRRDATCEVAREPEPEDTIAVAIVKWTDAESAARIEVGVRRKDRAAAWETRVIGFRRADSRDEKWRSAGLTIATLVGDRTESVPADSGAAGNPDGTKGEVATETPAPAPAPVAVSPEPPPGSDLPGGQSSAPDAARRSGVRRPFWLGGGAAAGSGFAGGVRVGGFVDGGWQSRSPGFVRGSLGLGGQPGSSNGVSTTWGTVSVGGGVRVAIGAVAIRPQVALRLDGLRATVGDDSRTHAQLGGQVGADIVWALGHTEFFAGVDAWRNRAPTEVRIGGRSAGTEDGVGWSTRLGVAYLFGKSDR